MSKLSNRAKEIKQCTVQGEKEEQKLHVGAMACGEREKESLNTGWNKERDTLSRRPHLAQHPTWKKESLWDLGTHQHIKAYPDAVPIASQSLSQSAARLGNFGHGVLALESNYTRVKHLWNLSLWLRKATEAREGAGKSLREVPEKRFHEAVKMYPGLCWRAQDVGEARVLACLPSRATYRK